MSTTIIPAGWYPDPAGGESARWWSGEQWTAHTRAPKVAAVAPTPVSSPSPAPVVHAAPVDPVGPPTPGPELPTGMPQGPTLVFPPTDAPSHPQQSMAQPAMAQPTPTARAWQPSAGAVSPNVPTPVDYGTWRGSPDTVGVWLLAFAPLMTFLTVMIGSVVMTLLGQPPALAAVLVLVVIAAEWVFAGLDRAALGARGYGKPGLAWMLLLPPLIYLIVRGRRVRAQGGRAWPPELAYFLQYAVLFALNLLLRGTMLS